MMWDGTVTTELIPEEQLFTKVIGLSQQEYKLLRYKVRVQNQILGAVETKPFSQGLAAVLLNSTGKWTHITQNGERAYDQEWDSCGEFILGVDGPVARVIQKMDNQDRKFGYIDIHGNLLNGLSSM